MQSGNLYVYGIGYPVVYVDPNGESIILTSIIIGAIVGATIGGVGAAVISQNQLGYVDGTWVLIGVGGLAGWGVGSAIAAIGTTAAVGCSETLGSTIYAT